MNTQRISGMVALFLGLTASAQGPLTLTLQQAMDMAATQGFAVRSSTLEAEKAEARSSRGRDSATDRFVKNMAGGLGTTLARSVGNALVRGILGGLTRK